MRPRHGFGPGWDEGVALIHRRWRRRRTPGSAEGPHGSRVGTGPWPLSAVKRRKITARRGERGAHARLSAESKVPNGRCHCLISPRTVAREREDAYTQGVLHARRRRVLV